MDKKSLIGLLLIAAILVIFSIFTPQAEVRDDAPASSSRSSQQQAERGTPVDTSLVNSSGSASVESTLAQTVPSTSPKDSTSLRFQRKEDIEEEIISLENDVLKVDFTSLGGRIKNVYLKSFKTYQDYVGERDSPLQLIDSASTYGLTYEHDRQLHTTLEQVFEVVRQTDREVSFESEKNGRTIGFTYRLKPGKYDLDHDIYFRGFSDSEVSSVMLNADFKLRSTEKHFPSEQSNSVTFFQYEDEGYDYIWREDNLEFEKNIEWIAFRQLFFTAIVSNTSRYFRPENAAIEIRNLPEGQMTYTKQHLAKVNLGTTDAGATVALNWYLGPVDYDLLAAYENGTEDVVELGPGLFRWVNKYAIRPLFTGLLRISGVGIAILLLTIVVKLILSPVNYKMYKSSAMMKLLRPEMEKINKKFSKKEDALKKQQATMQLYRETGVSPLSGCIPMLIQMPILFAIFRLFPASIELRQQPFLWAEDLSSFDSPIQLGFEIPFYGAHISIFTLLMSGITLLYTHYNSGNMQQPTQEGMPNLKYMMYLFPIVMIFFFNSYSSGLSFYYFISTLMTMGIMFAIKRFLIDEEKIHAKIAARQAQPKKKGKSKFQQRLEQAQRLQQERYKKNKKTPL